MWLSGSVSTLVSVGFASKAESDGPPQFDRLGDIEMRLREFRQARQWEQYHTPKNLAISVAIEVGELLEHFQWRTDADIETHLRTQKDEVAEELADVAIYVIQLAEVAGIGLVEAIEAKIAENALRYPVDISRGNSEKQPKRRLAAGNWTRRG